MELAGGVVHRGNLILMLCGLCALVAVRPFAAGQAQGQARSPAGLPGGTMLPEFYNQLGALPGQVKPPIRPSDTGPVAISAPGPDQAVVLQLNGVVRTVDLHNWTASSAVFQVPSQYQASDLAAGASPGGPITCLAINSRFTNTNRSFVLQIINGHEVWSWLRVRGVYVGIALDAPHGVAYVSNSSTNQIFRVQLGQEKQTPVEVKRILDNVERIGALAIDIEGQRLFAADASNRVFVIALRRGTAQRVDAPGLDDIRALAWDSGAQRLYVADSGGEAIWSIAVDGSSAKPQLVLRDRRFRQPSGVAVPHAGSLLATDESANAVLEVLTPAGKVTHVITLIPKSASE